MLFTIPKALELLNKEIANHSFGQSPEELYQPIDYLMGLGGKRMRPLLTLLSYHLFADEIHRAVKPAIAIEVFHNFTLMHDDIMDKAPLRRGQATVHEKWNENIAILSGDVMLVRAYDLLMHLEDDKLRKALDLFNQTAAQVCEGQQWDMNYETHDKVSIEEYLDMIRLKTAVLLGFSLQLGALVAGAAEKEQRLLYETGIYMGLGFQLMDDLLDVYGDMDKFGKAIGGDIVANKKTYLLILAREKAKGKDAEKLEQLLNQNHLDAQTKVTEVKKIYDKLDIRTFAELKISEYFDKAYKQLGKINVSLMRKNMLKGYIQKLAQREN